MSRIKPPLLGYTITTRALRECSAPTMSVVPRKSTGNTCLGSVEGLKTCRGPGVARAPGRRRPAANFESRIAPTGRSRIGMARVPRVPCNLHAELGNVDFLVTCFSCPERGCSTGPRRYSGGEFSFLPPQEVADSSRERSDLFTPW